MDIFKIDVNAYLKVIWKRKYILFLLFFIGGVAGYLSSKAMTPRFSTSITVIFPEAAGSILAGMDFLELAGIGESGSIGTETSIMASDSVLGKIVDDLELNIDRRDISTDYRGHQVIGKIYTNKNVKHTVYKVKFVDNNGNYSVRTNKGLNRSYVGSGGTGEWFCGGGMKFLIDPNTKFKKGDSFAFEIENPNITIAELKATGIDFNEEAPNVLNIRTFFRSGVKTKLIAEAIIDHYVIETSKFNKSVSKESAFLVKRRINDVDNRMKENQEKMTSFQAEHHIISGGVGTEAMVADIGVIKEASVQAELKRDQLRLILRNLDDNESSVLSTIDSLVMAGIVDSNTTLNDMREQIFEQQMLLSSLRSKYTEDHPAVIETKESIQAQERNLLLFTIQSLDKTIDTYEGTYITAENKFYEITETRPSKELKLAMLRLDIERDVAILHVLNSEYEALKIAEIKEEGKTSKIRVIDKAVLPEKADFPNKKKNAFLSAFLLMFIGVIWAVADKFFDFSPIYAKIPVIGKKLSKR